ncbi:MAG: T9SS type A sorting domain-containing protein [Chloroflexota bacterium]
MKQVIYYLAALALSVAPLYALTLAGENLPAVSDNVMNEPPPQTESVGWIDKGRYKELKAHNNGVASLRVTEDGKRIISVSGNEYKIWDMETGNLIKEFTLPLNSLCTVRILDDSFAVALYTYSQKNYMDHYVDYKAQIKILNLKENKVIYDFFLFNDKLEYSTVYVNTPYFCAKYDRDKKSLYFSLIYETANGGNSQRIAGFHGGIKRVNLEGDSISMSYIGDKYISNFDFINDDEIFAIEKSYYGRGDLSTIKYFEYVNSFVVGNTDLFNPRVIDRFENKTISSNRSNYYNFIVLPSKKLIVEYLDDSLKYKRMDDLTTIDSCSLPFRTFYYAFSLKEDNIILGGLEGIVIYAVPQGITVDSIPLPNVDYSSNIDLSPDSASFLIGFSDGYIRLFKSNALKPGSVSIKDPILIEPNLNLFPNPAGNELFLQKNEALLGSRVEIYSPTGVKAFEVPYAQRIDISALPAGMYFIKVGGGYSKFIKE